MKLTVDSSEPLEDAMRVLGALYGVKLAISSDGQELSADKPDATQSAQKPRTARQRTSTTKKARAAAPADADTGKSKQQATARSAGRPSNAEVRAWAGQNGFTVSGRGRIPASVMTAYRSAH